MAAENKSRAEVHVEHRGRRRHRRKGVTTENAALIKQQLIAEIDEEIAAEAKEAAAEAERARSGRAREVRLDLALQRYVLGLPEGSRANAIEKIGTMDEWVADNNLSAAVDVADRMIADMTKRNYSPATINRRLSILRRTARLAHLRRQWWIADVDGGFPSIKLDTDIAKFIQEVPGGKNARYDALRDTEQVAQLIAACENTEVADWITICAYTGMRVSEVLKIGKSYRIDFVGGNIVIPVGGQKNRNFDLVPIIERIEPLPDMTEALHRCPLEIHRATVLKHVKRAALAIGEPGISPHALRRTALIILLNAGVDMAIVSQIARHKRLEVTMKHYAHVNAELKRRAITQGLSKKAS